MLFIPLKRKNKQCTKRNYDARATERRTGKKQANSSSSTGDSDNQFFNAWRLEVQASIAGFSEPLQTAGKVRTLYAEDIALAMELKSIGSVDLIIEAVTGVNKTDIENAMRYGYGAYPPHRFGNVVDQHEGDLYE